MKRLALALPLMLAAPAAAQEAEPPTPASIVAASRADEWVAIAPEDLLVMDLAPDAAGRERRVVIQLMPAPFSQPWVENIRTLARAHWWDGTQVYRVVDNWVAQWGAGEDEDAGFAPHPLPEGIPPQIEEEYTTVVEGIDPLSLTRLEDLHAQFSAFLEGWPIGVHYPTVHSLDFNAWPIHCYASVGVARDLAPDTGTGAELYAVIGHAPRQLDRNIAVVGRVIAGIEHLSTLPRGTAEAGVYATRAEDVPIVSVRLASDMPPASDSEAVGRQESPPRYEYLGTDSESFARYVQVRANRSDAFYTVPAGGVDVCNVQVPIRPSTGPE
jgi:peptidylprolyl isomerase